MLALMLTLFALPALADAVLPAVEDALGADASLTAWRGRHPIATGDALWLSWEGVVWTLALVEREDRWVLELGDHPNRMDPVTTWSSAPSADPVLLWAGDLDGDDLLDIVTDIGDGPRLRLSSRSPAVVTD